MNNIKGKRSKKRHSLRTLNYVPGNGEKDEKNTSFPVTINVVLIKESFILLFLCHSYFLITFSCFCNCSYRPDNHLVTRFQPDMTSTYSKLLSPIEPYALLFHPYYPEQIIHTHRPHNRSIRQSWNSFPSAFAAYTSSSSGTQS